MARVKGCKRVPDPQARIIPFTVFDEISPFSGQLQLMQNTKKGWNGSVFRLLTKKYRTFLLLHELLLVVFVDQIESSISIIWIWRLSNLRL